MNMGRLWMMWFWSLSVLWMNSSTSAAEWWNVGQRDTMNLLCREYLATALVQIWTDVVLVERMMGLRMYVWYVIHRLFSFMFLIWVTATGAAVGTEITGLCSGLQRWILRLSVTSLKMDFPVLVQVCVCIPNVWVFYDWWTFNRVHFVLRIMNCFWLGAMSSNTARTAPWAAGFSQ